MLGVISFRKYAHANQTYVRWICKLEYHMSVSVFIYIYLCVHLHIQTHTYTQRIISGRAFPTESSVHSETQIRNLHSEHMTITKGTNGS